MLQRRNHPSLDLVILMLLAWTHMAVTHVTGGVTTAGTMAMVGVAGVVGGLCIVSLVDQARHRRYVARAVTQRQAPPLLIVEETKRVVQQTAAGQPRPSGGDTMLDPDAHPRLTSTSDHLARLDHMLLRKPSSTDVVGAVTMEATRTTDIALSEAQAADLRRSIIDRIASRLDIADTISVSANGRFMLLIERVDSKTALVDHIRSVAAELARPHVLDDHSEPLNVRTAIAFADTRTRCADTLWRQARTTLGLTEAGDLEIFGGSTHTARIERTELRADLVRALRDDQLDVDYQPVLSTQTGEIVGFEALMRWHHPSRGVIGPTTFLPIADELNLIPDMGRWLIDKAATQLRMWDLDHPDSELTMAINISGAELADHGLAGAIERICARRSVLPSRFILEVSERSITDTSAPLLSALSSTGARIALDDFGTGNRSLAELQEMPVDMIKIDRAVIASLDTGDNAHVASSIVELGELLGKPMVAEGVERPSQAALLHRYGFQYAQGHLYARAMSPNGADALLDQASRQQWRIEAPAAAIVH